MHNDKQVCVTVGYVPTMAVSISLVRGTTTPKRDGTAVVGTYSTGMHTCLLSSFKKNLEDISPFCWATHVLDFWWHLLSASKLEWAALFTLGRGICFSHSLRLTSGGTLANLFSVRMAAKPFSSMYLQSGIGGLETRTYCPVGHSVRPGAIYWHRATHPTRGR